MQEQEPFGNLKCKKIKLLLLIVNELSNDTWSLVPVKFQRLYRCRNLLHTNSGKKEDLESIILYLIESGLEPNAL